MLMMSTCMSQVRLGEYSRADGYYKLLLAHLVPKVCVYLYIYICIICTYLLHTVI